MKCPACGRADDWRKVEHDGVAFLLQAASVEEGEIVGVTTGAGLSVQPYVCEACGYVRLHALRDTTVAGSD
jgi:hypothetical protein